MSDPKKLFIKTYGCQMNVYDSERMAEAMGGAGHETTESPDDADMILLNTCHIREKAAEKVYSELGRLRQQKEALEKEGRKMVIAVAGCVAQAEGAEEAAAQAAGSGDAGPSGEAGDDSTVVDADFEEVDPDAGQDKKD